MLWSSSYSGGHARRLGDRAQVLRFPTGHFDIYVDEVFATSVAAQVEFLRNSLG